MKKPKKELLLPDEFVLDKSDVIFVIKSITKHWKRDDFNKIENAAYAANMELIKLAVKTNNDKVLRELFYSIITAVHQIETLNSLKKDFSKDARYEFLYSKQCEKIASGEAFVEN